MKQCVRDKKKVEKMKNGSPVQLPFGVEKSRGRCSHTISSLGWESRESREEGACAHL